MSASDPPAVGAGNESKCAHAGARTGTCRAPTSYGSRGIAVFVFKKFYSFAGGFEVGLITGQLISNLNPSKQGIKINLNSLCCVKHERYGRANKWTIFFRQVFN